MQRTWRRKSSMLGAAAFSAAIISRTLVPVEVPLLQPLLLPLLVLLLVASSGSPGHVFLMLLEPAVSRVRRGKRKCVPGK
jgi:hypothetical protein